MADQPIPALNDQPTPHGFTKYTLPDGRNVFLSSQLPQEHITQAIGAMLDQSAKIEEPATQIPPVGPVKGFINRMLDPKPMTNAVSGALDMGFNLADKSSRFLGIGQMNPTPEIRQQSAQTAAEHIVPQDLTTAGMMAGTAGGGVVAGLTKPGPLMGRALRTFGGMAGGAGGAQLEGKDPAMGAAMGGIGAVGGEVIGKAQEITRRAITNLTGGLYAKDAQKVGQAIGDIVPNLKAGSVEELRDLTIGTKGTDRLFQTLSDNYDRIGQQLNGRKFIIPGLSKDGETIVPKVNIESAKGNILGTDPFADPIKSGGSVKIGGSIRATSPAKASDPVYGGGQGEVTFDEVRHELTNLFKKGWGGADPTRLPSEAQVQAREAFHSISAAIKDALPQQLRENFTSARNDFRVGMNIIDMMRRANASSGRLFEVDGNSLKFQTNRLQAQMASQEGKLKSKLGSTYEDGELGPDVFKLIAKEVFRGIEPGHGGDSAGISLGRIFARQGLPATGGVSMERFPVLSAPNYAGNPKPFVNPNYGQTFLDMAMQRLNPFSGGPTTPQQ